MFTNQAKLLLIRHGVPERPGDSRLHPDLLRLLDGSVDEIERQLMGKEIGRVVLLSSSTHRTIETAQYIGNSLRSSFDVSDLIETPLLSLDSPLSLMQPRKRWPACYQLSNFIDGVADESSAVLAFTHEPVILSIAEVMHVEPDANYGGITVVR